MKILAVVGPTAAGKTGLALRVAETLGGEIIICDAYQLRAGLPILTTKPTASELARAPHHLVGALPLGRAATAAAYVALADGALADLQARGRPAILCGGTGLYLRALCRGLFAGPAADPAFRAELRREAAARGTAALHERLVAVDPEAAARIHRADYVRIERALEVYEKTGRPISALQAEGRARPPRYEVCAIGLDPGIEALRARIFARAAQMVAAGALEEVVEVAMRGPLVQPPLGYDLCCQALRGELSTEALCEALGRETARYARRQRTWFRGEKDLRWYPSPDEAPLSELCRYLSAGT